MALPVVAIVGRPNVGKSSLLNCLVRRMVSIVDPTAGVTRDRVTAVCEYEETYFELVDTGGYGIEDHDNLTEHVERQIQYAISQASLVLFVVDTLAGVTPLDVEVARMLRGRDMPIQLVANKTDDPAKDHQVAEFIRLGHGEPTCVSALHSRGRFDLLELIAERIRDIPSEQLGEPVMKVAVIGRQNTGKSTFINALAGREHMIVSEIPGTTRDAVDLQFERDGRTFVAIDTAGVRRKSKAAASIEYYGYTRVLRSIERADVVVLFIDATEQIRSVDKRLAGLVAEAYRPCVLVINKWDLAAGKAGTDEYDDYLAKSLTMLDYAPVVFCSAKDGHNVDAVIDTCWSIYKQSQTRVSTGKLNAVLQAALSERGPSAKRGSKPPRIYYATQVAVSPPTIILFVNHPRLVTPNYQRFLLNRLQQNLPFGEVPIRMVFRARRDDD